MFRLRFASKQVACDNNCLYVVTYNLPHTSWHLGASIVVARSCQSCWGHVHRFTLLLLPQVPAGNLVLHVQGQAVGSAAHLVALRREAIGKYNVKDAWTVDQLQAAFGAPQRATGTRPTASAVGSDGNASRSDEKQQYINR